jgi:hypothetical protein
MTNEIVTSNKMVEGSVSSNIYMILLGLFAISCYTCFVVGITYLFVIINIPKGQMSINKKYDNENDTRSKNIVEEKAVEEELVPSAPCIDTLVVASVVLFDRNHYINELIRIEKKIAFYDIRQHHVVADLNRSDVINKQEHALPSSTRTYFGEVHLGKAKLIIEYLTRINNLDSSIFKKMSSELLIYTKDYHTVEYDIYRMVSIDPINMIDFRNDNNGYTIDNDFIQKMLSDMFNGYNCDDDTLSIITKYSIKHTEELLPSHPYCQYHIDEINRIKKYDHLSFQTMYEIKLTEIAYELHNIFYKKIKEAYKKIEDKYNSIPEDFDDFDKLMDEVHNNEIEIDMLEEFDYKRRKLQLREFKARGYHIPWHLF